jgi:hypothetical protein
MEKTRQVRFKVFSGPNLEVPFAAVVAEFPVLYTNALPTAGALRLADELCPGEPRPTWRIDSQDVTLPALSAALSIGWIDLGGPNDLPVQLDRLDQDRWRIALGYYEIDATLTALQLGIELANAVFTRASGAIVNTARLQALAQRIRALSATEMPDSITRTLIRVARSNDIPVYSLAPGAQIWMYGQGAKAHRFLQSVSESESFLGVRLVNDKVLTDRIIHHLGLPGLEFGTAETSDKARSIAHRLGYPVVVKPSDRDMARDVTSAIDNDAAFEAAFARAKAQSKTGRVVIERHYQGDHHQLSVFGGKFTRATQIKSARAAADGKLRDVSAHIHPDNVAMAEAIARNFWLDGAGIDFVTPDISISWRDIPCAVVEVKTSPRITGDFLAERALGDKFKPGENGRIPCVLIIAADDAVETAVAESFSANGLRVGRTNCKATYMGSERRHLGAADLPLRVLSLLLDPACEALVVGATLAELERHGLPHVRFDLAIMSASDELPQALHELIATHVKATMKAGPESRFGAEHAMRLAAAANLTPAQ